MSIYSLTKEKIAALREEAAKAAQRVEYLATITGKEMWELDLDAFEKVSIALPLLDSRGSWLLCWSVYQSCGTACPYG